jgi:hypothetical protein
VPAGVVTSLEVSSLETWFVAVVGLLFAIVSAGGDDSVVRHASRVMPTSSHDACPPAGVRRSSLGCWFRLLAVFHVA